MQGARLMISRGIPDAAEAVPIRREPERPMPHAVPDAAPYRHEAADLPAPDFHLLHYRLAALERLSALRDKGALSAEEFQAEKALVLRLPAEELVLDSSCELPPRGPSLLGRLFGWKLLIAGLAAGFGFVAFTAPQDLAHLADRASAFFH
jgi:hypothetical protein